MPSPFINTIPISPQYFYIYFTWNLQLRRNGNTPIKHTFFINIIRLLIIVLMQADAEWISPNSS